MYLARETIKILQSNFINTANFFLSIEFLHIVGREGICCSYTKESNLNPKITTCLTEGKLKN